MKVEYKENAIVKSLLIAGFSEDYIEKAIASGDIKIEKAEPAAGDHESETKQEKDINKLEKEAVEKEKKVKKDEKDTAEDKNAEGIKKSDDDDMMKSFEVTIMKSIGSTFAPLFESMQRSIDGLQSEVKEMKGNSAPAFRSAGLDNLNALQKSMKFEKGEDGKYELNIISQRPAIAKVIEKALDTAPEDIRKSLESDALAYLTNPEAETVGEDLARYMYANKGIKFVK